MYSNVIKPVITNLNLFIILLFISLLFRPKMKLRIKNENINTLFLYQNANSFNNRPMINDSHQSIDDRLTKAMVNNNFHI